MSLSVGDCKEKLQPFVLANIEKEKAQWLWTDQLIDILNLVARDFNSESDLRREEYHRETTSGITNYELQRDIVRMLRFKYQGSDWRSQYYTWVQVAGTPFTSKIVLKETPGAGVKMDIWYLGQVENVSNTDSDEIDLPETVLFDYLELVKAKIREDYGGAPAGYYDSVLKMKGEQARYKVQNHPISDGIMRSWLTLDCTDDHYYDITDNWLGTENVYLSGTTYIWHT